MKQLPKTDLSETMELRLSAISSRDIATSIAEPVVFLSPVISQNLPKISDISKTVFVKPYFMAFDHYKDSKSLSVLLMSY